MDQLQVMQIK